MQGFKGDLTSFKDVSICTTVTSYDNKDLGGWEILLIYAQILFFGGALKVLLRPLNKVREAGNIVVVFPNHFMQIRLLYVTHITEAGLTINFELR